MLIGPLQKNIQPKKSKQEISTQTADSEKELENTIDNLLKEIKELQKLC